MKSVELKRGFFVALLLTAAAAQAQDYPAADFQPKVVYRDPALAEAAPTASSAPTSAAAVPCVNQQAQTQSEADPKYPASSFQPKVVFSGTGS
ncbi:hypothetical protein ACQE3E_20250 [Methylomonas sp. MED-D]|uniref:Uncharacterized protein n=1 Tax=Methylomonas koyamae TaxID=702114 RepID=A0A177N158_9GAMM|nr:MULTISPECIES: hypothetical protein [Methylomonas]NJA07821.1 hypothetical protein [Methylococcaceae bacterium WWC4]MDT4332222.1 hypothetical protein [Methylomonas sp. MV1]OAI11591.1 hypothetical protein A1355_15965 [Methylomonas koyamae]OHX35357.1 hypothetical protein BJL95_05230 [Methylomonas sp. LWB]WGS85605.1 hypothetical protein QC632_21620 [Methylomonas sp. UP202]